MGNETLMNRGKACLMNTYGRFPIALINGKGVIVEDADGNEYLDFLAGIAVNALGHAHPALCQVASEQMEKLIHCSNLYWIEPQIELAEMLISLSVADKVFFCNSGAEANEGAIKLARKYAKMQGYEERYEILSMENSFHGRTLATLTATGQEKFHQDFLPLPEGFNYSNFNDIAMLQEKVTEKTCAIIIEIIQGEGGVNPISQEFATAVAEICSEKDILLIVDEVQTGVGRTGKVFAYEHFGIAPDIITLAKGLAGGVPIGAFMAKEQVAAAFIPGDHGSTFGGNPLATACGKAVLATITAPDFQSTVKETAAYLRAQLLNLQARETRIKEIRGLGFLLGIEISGDVSQVVRGCLEKGLIIGSAGAKTLRLAPPLIVTKAEVDQAVSIIAAVLKEE
ncbi:MAG: acetylornithine transaminase [Clostridia bacterium]